MFQTLTKAYLIGRKGTEIFERELYCGASKADAMFAFESACQSLDASWHFYSPRDRIVVSMMGDNGENLIRTFGG